MDAVTRNAAEPEGDSIDSRPPVFSRSWWGGGGSVATIWVLLVGGLQCPISDFQTRDAEGELFKTLANIFRVPELRNKVLFTLAMLIVYRIGFHITLPGVDASKLQASDDSLIGGISNYLSTFSGGGLTQSSIFSLGIMPYISASIIIQLLGTVVPAVEKLKKEGEPGVRKINEWTRYLTVPICVIQAGVLASHLINSTTLLVYPGVKGDYASLFFIMTVIVLTASSVFLMWLGEQIDEYGIGNGISLIITAGIVSRMPQALMYVYSRSPFGGVFEGAFDALIHGRFGDIGRSFGKIATQMSTAEIGLTEILFLVFCFVFVIAGSILLTQAQRRIMVMQAKHVRGRHVYGGQKQYLPLRVNHGGVMPIIFAQSLMMFPSVFFGWASAQVSPANQSTWWGGGLNFLNAQLHGGTYIYEVVFCAMIFFFSYFWNTVQFQPKEMADQLRDYGSFIPGFRPGKRTADYLENVMTRITYVGAGFLCVIAVVPSIIGTYMLGGGMQAYQVTQFLGGTGLLIVISVMLDMMTRIDAALVMRDYGGLSDTGKPANNGRSPRPKGGNGRTGKAPSSLSSNNPKGLPA